ncbi:MAG: hypothetical protein KA239_02890 [Bacteroidia bacterium]|nr:hypothetical protein [Bacteroidia bacterium]
MKPNGTYWVFVTTLLDLVGKWGRYARKSIFGLGFLLWSSSIFSQQGHLKPARKGNGIQLYDSDGQIVRDADMRLIDKESSAEFQGHYDKEWEIYYFDDMPREVAAHFCLLHISHPDFETDTVKLYCYQSYGGSALYLARKGESHYWFLNVKIPYRVVNDVLAVRLNPKILEDSKMRRRWDSLKTSLGLIDAPEIGDSLQKTIPSWNERFSWNYQFYKCAKCGLSELENSMLVQQLSQDSEVVQFVGPILSKGLSIENSFVFVPKPSKSREALELVRSKELLVNDRGGNLWYCFVPKGHGIRIFDLTNALQASEFFEEVNPNIIQLYTEEEF